MNIGLVGGCLNKQIGISREQLYHHLLRDKLDGKYTEDKISISLGYYTSYNLMSNSVMEFMEKKSPGIVFLFLRPFPLMALTKIWIKYEEMGGDNSIIESTFKRELHPSFYSRKKMNWPAHLTRYFLDDAVLEPRRMKFGLRDLNLLAGLLAGLNDWTVKYLKGEIEHISNYCKSKNKKLVILSLPQNPESVTGNYVCNITNRKLKAKLKDIPFIDIFYIGKDYFEPDGIHYNSSGHKLLADILFEYLSQQDNSVSV